MIAANFAGGLFAYYDINLTPGSGGGQAFATWIATQGLPGNQQGATDDPDGDGFNNGAEFALGTNPNSNLPGDKPTLITGTIVDGGPTYPAVTFIRRKNVTGVTILVEGAANVSFTPTSPTTTLTPTDLGNGTESITVRGNTPSNSTTTFFFRIKVTAP